MTERNDIKEHAIGFLLWYCNGHGSEFVQQYDKAFDAYWASVQPPSDISADLNELITKVFDNEAAFMVNFAPTAASVEEFYMAGERCRVVVHELYGDDDIHVHTTSIPTADFLEWAANYD